MKLENKNILILVFGVAVLFLFVGCGSQGTTQFTESPTEGKISKPTGSNCGTDIDCFIKAAENCEKSKLSHRLPLNVFGMIITSTTAYEIKGKEEGKCVLNLKTEKMELDYTDEFKQQLLDSGNTEEKIEQSKEKVSEIAVGAEQTCKFSNEDLTAVLRGLKIGTISNKWDTGGCEVDRFLRPFTGETIPTPSEDSCDVCKKPCENCKNGELLCINPGGENQFCGECVIDKNCKDGFICIDTECVETDGGEGAPCNSYKDCNIGYFCAQGECIDVSIIGQLDTCYGPGGCDVACENCRSGSQSCTGFLNPAFPERAKVADGKCVECVSDFNCKEGSTCKEYRCV